MPEVPPAPPSRVSPRTTNNLSDDRTHRVLSLALQVINEVAAFDSHRVYLAGEDAEEVWHYSKEFLRGQDREKELDRSRKWNSGIPEEGAVQFRENARWVLLQRISVPLGGGYLSVSRREEEDAEEENAFSEVERYQVDAAARLLEEALTDDDALDILRRLLLNFLDNRVLLQDARAQEIIRGYLGKVGHVCHEWVAEDSAEEDPGPGGTVRVAFKRVNDNASTLLIAGHLSPDADEWKEAKHKRYPLLKEGEPVRDSFAAKAYWTRRTQVANRYPEEVPPEYRAFSDITKHMSAPVVAGPGGVLGVISVETTGPEDYRPRHAHAFTLLAAHAYWPLKRAWEREAVMRKAEWFGDELLDLRRGANEQELLDILVRRLRQLGYARGLISRVDYRTQMIDGLLAWGDRMALVKDKTHRSFAEGSKDRGDCQVIAVLTGSPVLIDDPKNDTRAERDATAAGHLEPFGIYLISDKHDRVIWTVHLERQDISSQTAFDQELIENLGMRATKAWKEERRTAFELEWAGLIGKGAGTSLVVLLEGFANLIVQKGIVSRCRVFRIEPGSQIQTLVHQAGVPEATKPDLSFTEAGHPILTATKPILCLLGSTVTPLEPGELFRLSRRESDPHAEALGSEGRTQWVEIPMWFGGRVIAKVVLDHAPPKIPGLTLDPTRDAFTPGEMRLMARLHSSLQFATLFAENKAREKEAAQPKPVWVGRKSQDAGGPKMTHRAPLLSHVWILESNQDFAQRLAAKLRGLFPHISVFTEPAQVRERILATQGEWPAVIVHDESALAPLDDGGSVAHLLRRASPLSMHLLFSGAAFTDPDQVGRWLEQRLIDHPLRCGSDAEPGNTVRLWQANWDLPAAHKLRGYIASHPAPDMPTLTDGRECFSLTDEHRLIVLGTERGREFAKVWDELLPT